MLIQNHHFLNRSYHVMLVFGPVYQMLFFWTLNHLNHMAREECIS